jgi:hypothetical protein
MSRPLVSRNQVVQLWGTPNATVGSVNEPRECEEHGHRFNEKWIYRLSPKDVDDAAERVVYWLRYDFVAAYLISKNGVSVHEDLGPEIVAYRDRRYHAPGR